MREYGQVQSAFWQSPDAQAWSDTGKLLALYLLTGPHSNGIGCFRLPDGYVMADLNWSAERVAKGFEELSGKGFANRFDGVVFLPNFLRWNRIANGNIAKARLGEFDALPKGQAKSRCAASLLEFCSHWDAEQTTVLETVCQTLSEGYANQNPTQPDPTQPERTLPKPTFPSADRFEDFWAVYPKKVAKQSCLAKWKSRKLDTLADKIITDVQERILNHRPWLDGYAPNPETYLNGARWDDAIETPKGKPAPGSLMAGAL
jgi:hypothetical protein